MDAVPSIRPLGLICGVLSIVQSVIWITLSTILLLITYCVLPIRLNDDSKPYRISNPYLYFLFTRYFKNEECSDTELTLPSEQPEIGYLVKPSILQIWLWFYFGLNILCLLFSCFLVRISARKKIACLNPVVFIWFVTVLEICGMDCALSTLFGIDIADLQFYYEGVYKFEAIVAAITMFGLFSRGIFLWFINLGLAIALFYSTLKMPKSKDNQTLIDTLDDDHTSYSSKFGTTFRDHPSQWQPPIDAFTYSNNNLRPPDGPIHHRYRQPSIELHGSHPGWTMRRTNSSSKRNNDNNSYNSSGTHETEIRIPSPDYSPILTRPSNKVRRKSITN